VDIFLGLLVAVASVQAALEGPRILAADRFQGWQSVVGCSQIMLFLAGAGGLLALWRGFAWAMPLLLAWALAALVSAAVATFAWTGFVWQAFGMAIAGTLAVDLVVLWWARTVSRRQRPIPTDGT
jgi:hypothetical protein